MIVIGFLPIHIKRGDCQSSDFQSPFLNVPAPPLLSSRPRLPLSSRPSETPLLSSRPHPTVISSEVEKSDSQPSSTVISTTSSFVISTKRSARRDLPPSELLTNVVIVAAAAVARNHLTYETSAEKHHSDNQHGKSQVK